MNYLATNPSGHKCRVPSVQAGKDWIAKQVQDWRNTGCPRIPVYSIYYDGCADPLFVTDKNGIGRDIPFVSKHSK